METIINKKQVRAILKVLNEKKRMRPTLSNIKVDVNDENIKLIFTDGHILVEMSISNNVSIVHNDDLFISYDDLNTWYKLATAKSNLVDDLDKLIKSNIDVRYPDVESAKEHFTNGDQKTNVRINSKLLNTCCELFDNNPIDIELFDMIMVLKNKVSNIDINVWLLGMKQTHIN